MSLRIGNGSHPAQYTQLWASICHSIGAHHMLCSSSFSTIFSLSLSLPLFLSQSQHLFLSLSLPSSFLSLGSTRVPYQSCMHLSWPACFILALLRLISGPYVRITLSSAVDLFAHGLRYGHSLDHFPSWQWITVTCTNKCHCGFLGSPRFWLWDKGQKSQVQMVYLAGREIIGMEVG